MISESWAMYTELTYEFWHESTRSNPIEWSEIVAGAELETMNFHF